jgi:hypothetical protein
LKLRAPRWICSSRGEEEKERRKRKIERKIERKKRFVSNPNAAFARFLLIACSLSCMPYLPAFQVVMINTYLVIPTSTVFFISITAETLNTKNVLVESSVEREGGDRQFPGSKSSKVDYEVLVDYKVLVDYEVLFNAFLL